MDAKDIKIPALPDPTTWTPEKPGNPAPKVLLNGAWFDLAPSPTESAKAAIEESARALIYFQLQKLRALHETLTSKQGELEVFEAQMRRNVEVAVPDATVAATGLRIWKEGPGIYAVERPITFFPQRIFQKDGSQYAILPGQFTPQLVIAHMQWHVASKELTHMHLFHLRSRKQFKHYHAWSLDHGTDCMGEFPRTAKGYPDLLRIFDLWEQQMQVVNISSLALETPEGLPNINSIRVDTTDLRDTGVWATPTTLEKVVGKLKAS